jgi:peptidyl-prolyl cis-trans isomerase A (cyclophilin A)
MKIALLLCVLIAAAFATEVNQEVKFIWETTVGNVTVVANREWAPLGFDRFMLLVGDKYFEDVGFFRVVPGFVVQFGISGNPQLAEKWRHRTIKDDKVVKSNTRGYISYAARPQPHTRTTQIFINYQNNSRLDGMGFAPFAFINEEGMKVIDQINSEYRERPSQDLIYSTGNAYLRQSFPRLSFLKKTHVISN